MKIFITGSTTGLGLLAGEKLISEGHEVIFHARNKNSKINPNYKYVFGDLNNISDVKEMAKVINQLGNFDSVIHNAGVYEKKSEELFMVNVLAPYLLTKLIEKPKRLVFLSSGMHLGGKLNLDPNRCSYSDTKLFDLMLAKYFADVWPDVYSNAVCPGWVPTRMGGKSAPDDLDMGAETQVWLAGSNDPLAFVSGKYFHHKKEDKINPIANSKADIEKLIKFLEKF